jgi:hypothetical protein
VDQSVSTPTAAATPRAEQLRDWAKTLATFLLITPLPAFMLWAAFSMPGMP